MLGREGLGGGASELAIGAPLFKPIGKNPLPELRFPAEAISSFVFLDDLTLLEDPRYKIRIL